tara:strand:- start:111 stop:563 length:453 start_codon:yes stop_codon:yes gene_type:complete
VRAASTDCPAIFQADFLFVELPGHSLALHRVVNGLFIADATSPDISFTTTEYVHLPQQDCPGFWGHFEVKENPDYDPNNPKKGAKSVRHHTVTRDAVLVYDVQVFNSPGVCIANRAARVSPTALRVYRLSLSCPMHVRSLSHPQSVLSRY